ncbi:hypothetical protein DCAR_0417076 [Daucus carota subsp. sativus]|uniref:Uncharacterized protein n=1 Tax=Daucus carota subsp. sativus TaxID=79200 RepID=A0A165Y0G3_DAUCS|nr:hypothetical protein DCAR_0417076 [Daucus carota subsp. sativus]
MFERLAEKEVIHICVGTTVRPNELYKTVLNFRRRSELKEKQGETEGNGENEGKQGESEGNGENEGKQGETEGDPFSQMLDNEGDAQVFEPGPSKTKGKKGKKTPKRQQKTRAKSANVTLPAPITPKTAFKSLPVRKSPRFSPVQTNAATARPTVVTEHRLFKKKVPKTTARRKGLSTTQDDDSAGQTGNEENAFEEEQASDRVESSKKRKAVKRKVSFDDSEEQASDGDTSDHDLDGVDTSSDGVTSVPKVKDNW